jgi:bifunctional ADP-heptose synthase (sugar kinase/adenylyltransferase)
MTSCITNGCYVEILPWHKKYLKEASKYGELIVLMNSAKSIRKLKNYKNIPSDVDRVNDLLRLPYVSQVIVFDEQSPVKLLKQLKPDYYVKGGDYTIDTINQLERKVLESMGTKIVFTGKYKKDMGYYTKNGYAKHVD